MHDKIDRLWWLSGLPLLLLFAIPILALVARIQPLYFLENLVNPVVLQAVRISFQTSAISMGLTLLLGTPIAYLIGKYQFPLKRLVDTIIDLPTVLPPSVAGVALLITFGRRGLLGSTLGLWGIQIAFTQAAVVLAQMFIAAPFYVRAAAIGFAGVDEEIQQAAALDGANRWNTFRHVILPLSLNAILSGSVMAWARALGEFGATILFAGNYPGRTQTMPLAIYLGFESNLDIALVLSSILILFSFLALSLIKFLAPQPAGH
ncbi:MAG: molybdate ABC transporter permease subunit [Chloroflexi bacterium]|nr:ABC transporter permease [Anaerolineaceae bacterium]NMB89932.1 molybdate ABC transporter permease subunit [Chloroflexota bacterium]